MPEISRHPFKPFVPPDATKLIIGTIPPYRFCAPDGELRTHDVKFYYGSEDNLFWKMVSDATNTPLQYANTSDAVDERKHLLTTLCMGITDMVESCVHIDHKSDDRSLADLRLRDLCALLNKHPRIDTLIYTSKYVATLVNKFADKKYHENWDKGRRNSVVQIGGKVYCVKVLYSPSPSANRRVKSDVRKAQYNEVFQKG